MNEPHRACPAGADGSDRRESHTRTSRTLTSSGGTIRIQLHDVIGNDDHVVALTTVRAEREGRTLEDNTVQVFHIRDGKATEVWTHPADQYVSDEFWS